ncbi:signal peptidase I [Vacuolonema iberomarrocanum]|uniref:signal peptidase I n=1 Tax=Vacuolonema iberomarrocanum TaxID=3454632 RepID=UPI003F6DF487
MDEPSEAATSESPATAETFEEPTPAQQTEENPWVETVKTIGVSIVLALGLRAAIVEARYIPSGSMLPTLEINDRLIVEKVSYHFNDPQRGDIVVFSPTDRLRQDNPDLRDAFIKRIIGLPGEMVEITGGQVFINGESIEENYIPAEYAPDYEWGPEEVPEGEYLVLGDNRNNSYDSHFWGYVPKRNIIGRAVIRFWPPQRVGTIDPIPVYLEDSNPDAVQPEIPAEGATTP